MPADRHARCGPYEMLCACAQSIDRRFRPPPSPGLGRNCNPAGALVAKVRRLLSSSPDVAVTLAAPGMARAAAEPAGSAVAEDVDEKLSLAFVEHLVDLLQRFDEGHAQPRQQA